MKEEKMIKNITKYSTSTALAFMLLACGGGGGGTTPSSTTTTQSGTNTPSSQTPTPTSDNVNQDTNESIENNIAPYQKGVGTLTDLRLGLVWQDDVQVEIKTFLWQEEEKYIICRQSRSLSDCVDTSGNTAASYCEKMVLAGKNNWRLPTRDELDYLSYIYVDKLKHRKKSEYWTSSTSVDKDISLAYTGASFYSSPTRKNRSKSVRCVSGTPDPNPSSIREGADMLIDNKLSLMWQDDLYSIFITKPWLKKEKYETCYDDRTSGACRDTTGDTAASYCSNMILGGYTDWRLPTKGELDFLKKTYDDTFLDENEVRDHEMLIHKKIEKYWTSEDDDVDGRDPLNAKTSFNPWKKTEHLFVRCVRDIK